jgi:hypothetical protein
MTAKTQPKGQKAPLSGSRRPVKKLEGQTTGENTAQPVPLPRMRCLSNVQGIQIEMKAVYRSARSGQMPAATASRLIYILQTMAALVESVTFEKRLAELERQRK